MQIKVTAPAKIHTTIQLPSSKSISNRALIINALGNGTHHPENLSDCDDTRVMIRALNDDKETIDIMAAGTAMRFLTAYLSVTPGTRIITGTERMQQRPIQVLVNALRELGADIEYVANDGFPPLRITGRELRKDTISLPGNVSSQYISALLMIAPVLTNGLTIRLTGDIISRPYINLTLQLMNDFGVRAEWTDDHRLKVEPQAYHSTPFYVESDWSAASYWYQIVALSKEAEVTLPGLFKDSYQGDSQVAGIFRSLGVETIYKDKTVILKKNGKSVERLDYDFINQPDLAQTFVVTCALLNIPFRFSGLQSLKIKETDRMAALITEMRKLGYILHETDGSVLSWEGERCTTEEHPAIDTYEDHRMAMAFAPTCLALPEILINNPQVVSKSYPRYWEDLRQAGFIIKEV
ncbi:MULTISPECIES: 3-phosphoshikimate 1-carboxyvinyltransferase [Phocaeicola]|uniref:3-phosphoshikimate 1-carboxyvinyltransferase n=1 Tax=Phocaeicola TaxID=909656 RepID=UPI000E41CAE6|nr:3-phosphoshikimate 1-carboxyvinyltransferase [Phocaeicola massiliensis]RGE98358.1 3-phosphoshikimate 1-carboxyvinyltransferase [Bacteroides sp. AM22-3LB]MBS4837141.1 3-phosphoshikimate 1-carboxyvinyltransferase [Phocaeicola massiliensis]MBT9894654.1 3-phosphoshikimate 1-carboxyvinyltransferase [Phocaeicola massiliensis]MBV3498727.1 3-phosphoshikimate 1-carboxyvinyltransferase [Phocaeicola massiliensis]MCM1615291.1 3-phosphoshikimate 1-carboxyvinyltransferase [Phocaeicola massiliensis]